VSEPTPPTPATARSFGLFGTKGGCGTTLLACHLAAAAADDRVQQDICLADFDFHRGDVLPMLGMRAPATVADLLALGIDVSIDAVRTAALHASAGFDVLGQPSGYEELSDVGVEATRRLLTAITEAYDTVVLDLGSHIDVSSIVALQHVDRVVLVSANRPLDLHNAHRMFQLLQRLGVPQERLRFVLSPFDPNQTSVLEVGEHLPIPVNAVVREDRGTARDLDLRAQLAYDNHPFSRLANDTRRAWVAVRGDIIPLEVPQARTWPWAR